MSARDPVIVGIGLSDYPKAPELSSVQHHGLALQRALDDCGLPKSEIDGYLSTGMAMGVDDPVSMAEYLGIEHRYIDSTMVGGSSFEFHVQHAAAAIRQGLCDTVLVTYGSDYLSRMGRNLGTGGFGRRGRVPGANQFEAPYGNSLVGAYAMVAQRHMHEFGTRSEHLAEIAVGVREYAALNPHALYRDPISVDDVLGSRMIADPLHKLDCCVISDGGGALLLTTRERARDLRKAPVAVLGAGGAQSHWQISEMPDFTTSAGVRAGAEAFSQAGVRPDEIDTIQPRRACGPTRSTPSSSTTASPSRRWCCSRTWASARRARAGPSWPRATCGAAACCRSTPTAVGSAPATPACAGSSC
jgi:acetyl-CoA acetyltransferase